MAIDHQNKRAFAMECKDHTKPIYASFYFTLKKKLNNNTEIHKAYPDYEIIYGIFSKSGYTERLLDIAKDNSGLLLINEDHLIKL